ncbi:IS3 family transposase [Halobacillus sp. A1]|uniref:IS3 family transposase n=1 Tax=Halobacillus sp. A1 TaxID=2880262 RepID=UPI0020A62B25|nr:IS3 family transposase [Halobacillus sp. A1]MCP3032694.1 IS3 family transposase [Halobacillus sp. A1]
MTPRNRRNFTDEFKKQVVQLNENGKPRKEILKEYELSSSAFDRWLSQFRNTGSFKEEDNRTAEQNENIRLKKENQRLMMEVDVFKASGADHGTKVKVIQNNRHQYSVSAMCAVLQLPKSTFYYEAKEKDSSEADDLTRQITGIFQESRQNYGTRKIKHELYKKGYQVSRRRIGRIMKEQGLVSKYTIAQFKPMKSACNESKQGNTLNREFTQDQARKVVVSDLTYVRVHTKWHYICTILDLYNREIIGYSSGPQKDAALVQKAFASIDGNLDELALFHTDRGSEFKNQAIEDLLQTFQINRSLSMKGCPYDNAVAEATYKVIKTEFVYGETFESQEQLNLALFDYVHWYNHIRIHGTLNYLSPIEFKKKHLNEIV